MKKIVTRVAVFITSVLLMCGTFGTTSHAACDHSVGQKVEYYTKTYTVGDMHCPATYYIVTEYHYYVYRGCKYCDYVILKGAKDFLANTTFEKKMYFWKFCNCAYHLDYKASDGSGLRM